jgi:transcriptional regulator with XRE-family HTH domain
MSSKYNHEKIKQSIQGNLRRYEAIALSMVISFEIEDFIKERGISKQELAKAAGVSPSYLSQVFAGDRLLNLTMLAGISQKYQVKFHCDIQEAKVESIREYAFESFGKPHTKKANIYNFEDFKQVHNDKYNNQNRVIGSDGGNPA